MKRERDLVGFVEMELETKTLHSNSTCPVDCQEDIFDNHDIQMARRYYSECRIISLHLHYLQSRSSELYYVHVCDGVPTELHAKTSQIHNFPNIASQHVKTLSPRSDLSVAGFDQMNRFVVPANVSRAYLEIKIEMRDKSITGSQTVLLTEVDYTAEVEERVGKIY
uniref:Uncharacterized protein n=1 Tax=Glossina pallidipes TaxID=7398 RepID=A0A1A9ZIT8_GLOPL